MKAKGRGKKEPQRTVSPGGIPAAAEREELVRFGVAMDGALLEELDRVVKARGGTRSELLRDLARSEVQRARRKLHLPAVAALTLVYDHHVRDLTEKLTEMQHDLGDKVRSSLHVHLDHARCMEVIIIRGWADEIREAADRLLATRGVLHGGLELYAEEGAHGQAHAGHGHGHGQGHG